MAYTTINKSTEHFDTKIYTGNGSSQTLDMDNLGLLWMKNRTEASNHNLFDVVRGGYYTSAHGPNLRSNGFEVFVYMQAHPISVLRAGRE